MGQGRSRGRGSRGVKEKLGTSAEHEITKDQNCNEFQLQMQDEDEGASSRETGPKCMAEAESSTGDGKEVLRVRTFDHKSAVVPRESVDSVMKSEVSNIKNLYTTTTISAKGKKGTKGITRSTILGLVEGPPDDELVFKRGFLMLVLGDLLCPTTCHRLSSSLLLAVTVAMDAAAYDWCSFVVEHLLCEIDRFSRRFNDNVGYAAGCGGCTYFLAIMYLDRLCRPPFNGVYVLDLKYGLGKK